MLLPLLVCLPALAASQDGQQLLDPAILFAAETVDHRPSQSPVKDQGLRGTCAAFALTGALETFPGVPTDLCEQLLYATRKLHEQDVETWLRAFDKGASTDPQDTAPKQPEQRFLKEGNALADYVALFGLLGTCHGSVWPYDPTPPKLDESVPIPFREYLALARITPEALTSLRDVASKWGFTASDVDLLTSQESRDVKRLKAELRSGTLAIPIGYPVHDRWSEPENHALTAPASSAVGPGARVILTPALLERFAPASDDPRWLTYGDAIETCRAQQKDLVAEVQAGRWLSRPHSPAKAYGGHAVLIVGFTDDGFIIKNSWGPTWAASGYAVVSYDYHRLYAGAAAILRAPTIRPPALNPFEVTARMREGRFRTKVQPINDTLVLSTWMEDLRDAPYETVEYIIEHQPTPGTWTSFLTAAVCATDLDHPKHPRTGAPLTLDAPTLATLRTLTTPRLRVRYSAEHPNPKRRTQPLFQATRTFPTFTPHTQTTQDLIPTF